MKLIRKIHLFLVGSLVTILLLAACNSQPEQPTDLDILGQAAAEATAIIQQAQATAMVLQAQTQATQLMAEVTSRNQTSISSPTLALPVPTSAEDTFPESPTPEPSVLETPTKEVKVMGVGFAGEGGFIMIRFLAPPEEAEKWWQGSVTVTDEASGDQYIEIPVMPKIGPLIGRPKQDSQIGYVMLINAPPGLQSGALVTVTLGNYRFEHVPVE